MFDKPISKSILTPLFMLFIVLSIDKNDYKINMKIYLYIIILILLCGNVLSSESIFNVNNIKIEKNDTQTLENSF